MIENDALAALIRQSLPDADVEAHDYSGTMDHFNVTVRSQAFAESRCSNNTVWCTVRLGRRSKTAASTPFRSRPSFRRTEKNDHVRRT